MHESRRWRLVCYDIRDQKSDPKRYRRAHRLIKGYGDPLQYSVFRCRLDDRQTAQLRAELAKILTPEDSLLIINLCPGCAGQVVTCNHAEEWDRPPPSFSVVLSPRTKAAERGQP